RSSKTRWTGAWQILHSSLEEEMPARRRRSTQNATRAQRGCTASGCVIEGRERTDMASPGFDLTGRVALVTGGTSGLGRAIAVGLARAGATVVVGSRDEAKIAETVAELAGIGTGHSGRRLDVADPASIEETF